MDTLDGAAQAALSAFEQNAELPLQTREARFQPSTVDEEARTVELVWTTGATVRRRSWFDGKFDEQLILDDGAVRLDRLNNGASLLDSHWYYELSAVLGVVERAWLVGRGKSREGRAVVRFSDREDVEPLWRDVRSGIIRNVSVGYAIHRTEKIERADDVPLLRVVDWEPLELSLVSVPADAGAQVRSEGRVFPLVIRSQDMATKTDPEAARGAADKDQNADGGKDKDKIVTKDAERNKPEDDAAAAAAADAGKAKGRGGDPDAGAQTRTASEAEIRQRIEAELASERERAVEIRRAAKVLKISNETAERFIAEGISLEAARNKLFAMAAERDAADQIARGTVHIEAGEQDEDTTRGIAIRGAILHRYAPSQFKLDEPAREYVGLSLLELARHCVQAAGIKTKGLSRGEVAKIAITRGYGGDIRAGALHTTSDFPNILADVANKTLRQAYEQAPQTFKAFCRRGTLPDFRGMKRVQFGEAPVLLKKNEHGEFVRGSIGDAAETIVLTTYGRMFGVTRETIVNDDLDAFTRAPALFGAAAANKESDVVWGVILANAAMADGTALFHANHGNLAASGSGAPAIATVAAAKAAMSKQTGLDGVTLLNVMSRYLIVPTEHELAAAQLVTAITPNLIGSVVPDYIRSMIPIAEPRLSVGINLDGVTLAGSAVAWYLAADPSQIDTVEYAYLEGEEGVMVDSRPGWNVEGIEIRARLDFAAKAIDWRGMYRSDGVA